MQSSNDRCWRVRCGCTLALATITAQGRRKLWGLFSGAIISLLRRNVAENPLG